MPGSAFFSSSPPVGPTDHATYLKLKLEVLCPSEASVSVYSTTWRYTPEDHSENMELALLKPTNLSLLQSQNVFGSQHGFVLSFKDLSLSPTYWESCVLPKAVGFGGILSVVSSAHVSSEVVCFHETQLYGMEQISLALMYILLVLKRMLER